MDNSTTEKQKLRLTKEINAPKEKIWDVLLQDETYRIWTSVFHPGSYADTDNWEEGSMVYFKTPEGDGLASRILEHKPQEVISFEHLAVLKNGVEDTENEEAKKWKGFKETYWLKEKDGACELVVEQDITNDYAEYFEKIWPQALDKVKELSEKS